MAVTAVIRTSREKHVWRGVGVRIKGSVLDLQGLKCPLDILEQSMTIQRKGSFWK